MMERWQELGSSIAAHMPLIVLGCVSLGVLFPSVFGTISPVVPALFAFMTFQGSLNNTARQLADALRSPAPLLLILGASLVLMPLLAYAAALFFFGDNINLVTGILIEYCVPVGVVSFMWVGMYKGNGPLGLAAILVSTVMAPFTIPATLQLLLGQTVAIDAMGMIADMVVMIAVPAIAGTLVNDFTKGWGRRTLSPALSPASKIALIVIITANSTKMSAYALHLTPQRVGVALFILAFACLGFFLGIFIARLTGQPHENVVTMSFDCGLRNISAGAVIATQYFPSEVVFPVMCGTIFQQLLASLFGRAMQHLAAYRDRQGK